MYMDKSIRVAMNRKDRLQTALDVHLLPDISKLIISLLPTCIKCETVHGVKFQCCKCEQRLCRFHAETLVYVTLCHACEKIYDAKMKRKEIRRLKAILIANGTLWESED